MHANGTRESVRMPNSAVAVVRDILAKLVDAEGIAGLRGDDELSPEQAAAILGISRPRVVRRMDSGRLPFRYVGAHRRCCLSDVLKLHRRSKVNDRQPTAWRMTPRTSSPIRVSDPPIIVTRNLMKAVLPHADVSDYGRHAPRTAMWSQRQSQRVPPSS